MIKLDHTKRDFVVFSLLSNTLADKKDDLDCPTKVIEYLGNLILKDIGEE